MNKLFLTMLLALTATTFSFAETTRIYCQMTHSWWWADDGKGHTAAISLHTYGGANATTWPGIPMTEVDAINHIWAIDIDLQDNTAIIFVRTSYYKGDEEAAETNHPWGAKSGDLLISEMGTNNLYTITSAEQTWDPNACTGDWSQYTYEPEMKRFYCKMPYDWWWANDDQGHTAAISLYGFTNFSNNGWPGVPMTELDAQNHIWTIEIDVRPFTGIIFTRSSFYNDVNYGWGAKTADLLLEDIGENDLYTITSAEQTWDPNACTGDWSKYSQITTAISNTVEETKTVKHIVNGQLFILRDGKTFNTLGAELK